MSINVQLVCDTNNIISDVVARWPGSVHDSTIFENSHIRALLETGQLDGILVGDGGYASKTYMLTPVINPTTAAESTYNAAHVLARNCIERTNGMLKSCEINCSDFLGINGSGYRTIRWLRLQQIVQCCRIQT